MNENETQWIEGDYTLVVFCGAPAPLVANGGGYVGCSLDRGHEGDHHVELWWR